MEFAMKVLNRYSPVPGKGYLRKRFVEEVTCAYCDGGGADPKYSSASGCPVCNGAGSVRVTPPVVACRPRAGNARVNGNLVCLTCREWGWCRSGWRPTPARAKEASAKRGFFIVMPAKGKGSPDVGKGELT